MQIKVIFIRMVSQLDSLWNRGTRELGNGLLQCHMQNAWQKTTGKSNMLLIFGVVWPCFSLSVSTGKFLSVCSFLIVATKMIFWIFFSSCPLSLVLHVTLTNLQKFSWIWVSYEVITIPYFTDYFITCYTQLSLADETQQGWNSCPRLQSLASSLDSIISLSRWAFYVTSECIIVWLTEVNVWERRLSLGPA